MIFKSWLKTSLIEYPGKISTVLFTGGCNFRCPFCYNKELVLNDSRLPDIESDKVLDYLAENRKLYQAVTVTGGEPTIHKSIFTFFQEVKDMGFLAGLETNGSNSSVLKSLIKEGLIDFVGMDTKAALDFKQYSLAAGIPEKQFYLFEEVLKSIELLKNSNLDYEFRTTVVPGIHTEDELISIALSLKGARRFVIQQFAAGNNLSEEFEKKKPLPAETLTRIKRKIHKNFIQCEIRSIS